MQQYGLAKGQGNFVPTGKDAPAHTWGQKDAGYGAILLEKGSDRAIQEAAIKQCGDGWILAVMALKGGNVCATVSAEGEVGEWVSIEKSVSLMPGTSQGHPVFDKIGGRMARIAPLGSREMTTCGSNSRFLFGYETAEFRRWLVEVDGNCQPKESTRQEVTNFTTWPLYQDWATTVGGAVVWITSWITSPPSSVYVYAAKGRGTDGYQFDVTEGATDVAQLTVYYP